MVAQSDSNVALEENPDQQLQNQPDDDAYEAEETLSLCDLPIYSDSAHWDDFSKDYQSSSFDHDEDNFFEFFSEELTASTYASENNDIIFCGKKLISYVKEVPHVAEEKKTTKKNTETSNKGSTKKWGLFRWKIRRFRRSQPKVSKYSKQSQVKDGGSNSISFPMSSKRCDPSLWKVSVVSSNRSKSKWHLFMSGITKFPTEMELRDIKSRQSRRNRSTMKREASNEIVGKGSKEWIKEFSSNSSNSSSSSSSSSSRAKGLWGLLRVLGCSSQRRNSLVF